MTVTVTDNTKRFHGSGSGGPFTWTWRFLANSDILVYRISNPDEDYPLHETRELLLEGIDYTLAGAGSYTGGSLILNAALESGTDLLIERATPATQSISIRNQGNNFRPEVHENVFDRLTMLIQDMPRSLNHRVSLLENRVTEVEARGFTVTLPVAATAIALTIPVDTQYGNVVVDLPPSGTVTIIKRGADAYGVTFAVTVPGQTIDPYDPLSGDGEYAQLTLVGSNWVITGAGYLGEGVYNFFLPQMAVGIGSITEVPTISGPVVVYLPASGTVKVIKKGADANQITFAVTVPGQTIDPYDPLSGDGEYMEMTLFGTVWRKTG